jgi:asparagine synthase (glutamine-hydrolysing)
MYGRLLFDNEREHYLNRNSWIAQSAKSSLFRPEVWQALDEDAAVNEYYASLLADCDGMRTPDKYLRLVLQVNLAGLLGRLDSSTMLASVEGRVPIADHRLADWVFGLPFDYKLADTSNDPEAPWLSSHELAVRCALQGKRVLREAMRGRLPERICNRPKVSFPLPFQDWFTGPQADWVRQCLGQSPFAQAIFQPMFLDAVLANLEQYPLALWPLLNVALWGDRWFVHRQETEPVGAGHASA